MNKSIFTIHCTGDVVVGDTILFTEGVFTGSHRKPKFAGERTIIAEIMKDSYGELKQQHTFTLKVIFCEGIQAIEVNKTIRRKGRNVYRNGTKRKPWSDETQRTVAQDEKHTRGDVARAVRDQLGDQRRMNSMIDIFEGIK